eukprot:EC719753.1.p2 GENE.EC719753.1~~EC719753.1.p2  ORF type:complete len:76 (+),score=17.91 EC719753.1:68-295(+)
MNTDRTQMKSSMEEKNSKLNELFGKKLEAEQKLFALKWNDPSRDKLRKSAKEADRAFVAALRESKEIRQRSRTAA